MDAARLASAWWMRVLSFWGCDGDWLIVQKLAQGIKRKERKSCMEVKLSSNGRREICWENHGNSPCGSAEMPYKDFLWAAEAEIMDLGLRGNSICSQTWSSAQRVSDLGQGGAAAGGPCSLDVGFTQCRPHVRQLPVTYPLWVCTLNTAAIMFPIEAGIF